MHFDEIRFRTFCWSDGQARTYKFGQSCSVGLAQTPHFVRAQRWFRNPLKFTQNQFSTKNNFLSACHLCLVPKIACDFPLFHELYSVNEISVRFELFDIEKNQIENTCFCCCFSVYIYTLLYVFIYFCLINIYIYFIFILIKYKYKSNKCSCHNDSFVLSVHQYEICHPINHILDISILMKWYLLLLLFSFSLFVNHFGSIFKAF